MKKRYEEVMEQLTMTEKMRERILKNVAEEMTDVSSAAAESASNDPVLPTPQKKSTTRIARFSALQGILAAAACAALVLLTSGLLIKNTPSYAEPAAMMSAEVAEPDTEEAAGRSAATPKEKTSATEESALSIANGMVDVSSDEELSQAVGFAVPDIAGYLTEVLSFTGEEIIYTSYWGEMAQITYRGTVSDDASGDAAADRGSGEASDEFCFRISEGTEDNSGDYNTYADVRTVFAGDSRVTLKGNGEKAVLAIWSADGYSYSLSAPYGLSDSEWEALVSRISEKH